MIVDDLIQRTKVSLNQSDEYWLELEKDLLKFLKSNESEENKDRLRFEGRGEMVHIICDGIRNTGKEENHSK